MACTPKNALVRPVIAHGIWLSFRYRKRNLQMFVTYRKSLCSSPKRLLPPPVIHVQWSTLAPTLTVRTNGLWKVRSVEKSTWKAARHNQTAVGTRRLHATSVTLAPRTSGPFHSPWSDRFESELYHSIVHSSLQIRILLFWVRYIIQLFHP